MIEPFNSRAFQQTLTAQRLAALQPWVLKQTEFASSLVNSDSPNLQAWTYLLDGWIPLMTSFEKLTQAQEALPYQEIYNYLEEIVCLPGLQKIVSNLCGEAGSDTCFEDDDTLVEHLQSGNFKSIKEILRPLVRLSAYSGMHDKVLTYISQALTELCSMARDPKNCNLVWPISLLMHALRIFFTESVNRLHKDDTTFFDGVVGLRLKGCVRAACLFFQFEDAISNLVCPVYLQSNPELTT